MRATVRSTGGTRPKRDLGGTAAGYPGPMVEQARRPGVSYLLVVVGAVVVAVAGFAGFRAFPGVEAGAGAGLIALGAAAGVASFFSPCSFPLLLTILTRDAGTLSARAPRIRRAVLFGASMSIGAVVFVLGLGALISLGGREFAASITFTSTGGRVIRIVVGLLLILLGLAQARVIRIPFHGPEAIGRRFTQGQARLRRERPVAGFALFGFGYLLAGFG